MNTILKVCSLCKTAKPLCDFYKNKSRHDGIQHRCKQCMLQCAKNNYPKRRAKQIEYSKAYNKAHQREKNAYNRKWAKTHREVFNKSISTYHARKAGLLATLTIPEWEDILAAFGYSCAYCGKAWFELKNKLAQEHVIPVSRGGTYTKDNIVPSCTACNSRKKDRTPEEADMPLRKPLFTYLP